MNSIVKQTEVTNDPQDPVEETLATFREFRQALMTQTHERLLQKAQQTDLTNPRNVALFQNALADLQASQAQMEATLRAKLTPPEPPPSLVIEGEVLPPEPPKSEEAATSASKLPPFDKGDDDEQ